MRENIDEATIKHRHHGSWFCCRKVFSRALLMLAAVRSGKIEVFGDWHTSIELVIKYLSYWAAESPDLFVARTILETLYSQVT